MYLTAFWVLIISLFTLLHSGMGTSMEDGAIHLAMAKGFWSEGFFSLSFGTPAGSVTSPLWIFAEAVLLPLTGSTDAVVTVLGALSIALFSYGVYALFRPEGRGFALTLVAIAVTIGPIQWHGWSGMETLAFSGAVLLCLSGLREENNRSYGTWMGVAILLRMEAILLLGIAGASLWWKFRQGRNLQKSDWIGPAIGLAAFALFGAINLAHVGHFMPTTGAGKRFLYGVSWHGADAIPILHIRLWNLLSDWGHFLYGALAENGIPVLFWLSLPIGALGIYFRIQARCQASFYLILWCAIVTTVYALELPVRDVAGRYQALNLIVLPWAWSAGIYGIAQRAPSLGTLLLATLLLQNAVTAFAWSSARQTQLTHLDAVHQDAGVWVRDNNPECLPVILGEIGWISFHAKQTDCSPPILDYYALADPVYFEKASRGEAFSAALSKGESAVFALSMLSTNLPSIHLRLDWPDGPPGQWQLGQTYQGIEAKTGSVFRFEFVKKFEHQFPVKPPYHHPAGRVTGMNPLLVGVVTREN